MPGWVYVDPLDVPCRWCGACIGERCRTQAGGADVPRCLRDRREYRQCLLRDD